MNQQRTRSAAIAGLRWTLGLVVLFEAVDFTFSPSSVRHFAHAGFPPWIRPALGGAEIVAALLFLVPAVSLVGGYFLLLVFAVAILIHFLHGQFDVGALLVYAAAAIVCIVHGSKEVRETLHDR